MTLLPPAAAVACALVAAGVGVWILVGVWPFTVDDAFITFRYAQNLAAGHGATFNPGQNPVEGYTSPSWMLFLTIPHLLRLDAVIFAKIAGILCTVGLLIATLRLGTLALGRDTRAGRSSAVIASTLLIALLPATWIHAISGMETALFTCLLLFFFEASAKLATEVDRRVAWRAALLGLLVGLTRPEGNLAVVVALAVALALAPKEGRRRALGVIALTYALPLASYLVWRLAYYRVLFPLAFYVKVEGTGALSGLGEFLQFARNVGGWLGLLVAVGLSRFRRELLPAAAAATALVLFFLLPTPIMAYDWRYLFPVVPLLVALAAPGLALLGAKLTPAGLGSKRQRTILALEVQGVIVGAMGFAFLHNVGETIMAKRRYAQSLEQCHVALGKLLNQVGPINTRPLIAVADAGAIPYYSGWRTIDTFGLNDAVIARSGRHDPDYILEQRPDLVILNSGSSIDFRARMPWLDNLYERCLETGFTRFDVWFARSDEYYLWLLGSPQSPLVHQLQQLVRKERTDLGTVVVEVLCTSCKHTLRVQANLGAPQPLRDGMLPFPADDVLRCPHCGTSLDVSAARHDVEQQSGGRVVAP